MPPAVLHPDDDRAEAGPGVEPGVEHDELLGAAVYAHRGERGEHFVHISARISPGVDVPAPSATTSSGSASPSMRWADVSSGAG